jgi:competence protein ComEA
MKQLLALVFTAVLAIAVVPFAAADQAPADTLASLQTVNINTADAQTLTSLKGIGLKRAEDIVAWRDANGSFTSIEQLAEIKGIGTSIIETNRERLSVE